MSGPLIYRLRSISTDSGQRILVVMCFQCKDEIASDIILNMPFCKTCAGKNTAAIEKDIDLNVSGFPSNILGFPVAKD